MPKLQYKLLALLTALYTLPFVTAECSPYLNEGTPTPIPNPEKCWTCAKPNNGFRDDGRAFPDDEKDGVKSWWDFYCKYTKDEGQYSDGTKAKDSTILCPYDGDGNSRISDSTCPSKAIPKPNCEPVRPYSGKNETCCGPECQLRSDQCISCPPKGADFSSVDVTVNYNILTCIYNRWSAGPAPPQASFDAQTGTQLGGDQLGPASRAQGCTPKPISQPGADCPTDATHDQCVKEAQQDAYRSFMTWNRCASKADYCKHRSMSDDCWACPTIEGTDAVYEQGIARDPALCIYYKRNSSGVLQSANTECHYNLGSDGSQISGAAICPAQAGKDLTCQRLKGA